MDKVLDAKAVTEVNELVSKGLVALEKFRQLDQVFLY